MANAKQCDRCKKFFLFGDVGVSFSGSFVDGVQFRSSASSRSGIDDRDLCRDCIEDLKLFLGGVPIMVDKEE